MLKIIVYFTMYQYVIMSNENYNLLKIMYNMHRLYLFFTIIITNSLLIFIGLI